MHSVVFADAVAFIRYTLFVMTRWFVAAHRSDVEPSGSLLILVSTKWKNGERPKLVSYGGPSIMFPSTSLASDSPFSLVPGGITLPGPT